jgi:hypothetical protein
MVPRGVRNISENDMAELFPLGIPVYSGMQSGVMQTETIQIKSELLALPKGISTEKPWYSPKSSPFLSKASPRLNQRF